MKRFMVSFNASVSKGIALIGYSNHVNIDVPDDYKIKDYASLSEKADPAIIKDISTKFADAIKADYHIMAFSRYEE